MEESSQPRCTSVGLILVMSLKYPDFVPSVDVLDGGMITLAIATLNFIHPGQFLYRSPNNVTSDYPPEKRTSEVAQTYFIGEMNTSSNLDLNAYDMFISTRSLYIPHPATEILRLLQW